jgi:hypothetical protein
MSEVTETDKEVKVVVEMPGVSKENIKINAYENKVEVKTEAAKRKYHEVIEIPVGADIETAKRVRISMHIYANNSGEAIEDFNIYISSPR